MIHYHGLPITPATAAVRAVSCGHAFVSFRHPSQLTIALECASSFAVDNGAFSAWRSGEPVTDWSEFYDVLHKDAQAAIGSILKAQGMTDKREAKTSALVITRPAPA